MQRNHNHDRCQPFGKTEMKRIIMKIIMLILIITSCTGNKKSELVALQQIENKEKNTLEENEQLDVEEIRKIISQKWITNTIQYTDEILNFVSFKDSVTDKSNKFIIEFSDNGNLNLESTSKNYVCGNGMPYFDKASWEFKKGRYNINTNDFDLTNNLILHIRGGLMLENRFEFKREYLIKSITENELKLEQVNSILEKFITDGNNFYKE
jgi:hypothetical protein